MKKNSSAFIYLKNIKKNAEKLEIKHGYVGSTGLHLTVDGAAHRMNCSTRRVRQLLMQQRLKGYKIGKAWKVAFPLTLTIGTRGPITNLFKSGSRKANVERYL